MSKIGDLIMKLNAINNEAALGELVRQVLERKEKEIAQLNRDQLENATLVDNTKMDLPYSNFYKQKKARRGLNPNVVNLRFSGSFHRSIKVDAAPTGLEFTADVGSPAFNYVQAKYGKADQVLGLTPENEAALLELIRAEGSRLIQKKFA